MEKDYKPTLTEFVMSGAVSAMDELVRAEEFIREHEVQAGIRGEELVHRGATTGVRHSNGDREARIVEQQ